MPKTEVRQKRTTPLGRQDFHTPAEHRAYTTDVALMSRKKKDFLDEASRARGGLGACIFTVISGRITTEGLTVDYCLLTIDL